MKTDNKNTSGSNETIKSVYSSRHSTRIFGAMIALVFAMLILGQIFLPKERLLRSADEVGYQGEFIRILDDGSTETVPGRAYDVYKYDIDRNEPLILETRLPEYVSDSDTFFYNSTHQSVYLYLKDDEDYGNSENGELVLAYDTTDSPFFGTSSASKYVQLYMNREMSGKVLRMVITADSGYSGRFDKVYYGRADEVWGYIVKMRIPALLMAIVLFVVGAFTIIGCHLIRPLIKKNVSLVYIGWCAVAVGMWILCESRFRAFIFDNGSWTAIMAFFFLLIYPGTVLIYINDIQDYRFDFLHRISLNVLGGFFALVTVLHFTKVFDVMRMMNFIYAVDYFTMLSAGISIIIDIKNKRIKGYRYAAFGFVFLTSLNVVELIADVVFRNIHTGIFTGTGTFVFIIMAVIDTVSGLLEAENQKNRAVAVGEAKSMFLANMSHEIRTPINAVLGMNEMILRDTKEDFTREYATNIESSGNLLLSIINDILDFSKIESGKMDIIPADYELSSVINDLVNALRPKAEAKDLGFVVEVDKSIPEYLNGDENRIRQIIINIINNAIKYTEQGHVTLRINGERSKDEFMLTVSVSDTGKGIKDEDIGKLFESFRRVDEESNRNIEGTGLGLSIAGSLTELMEGRIEVESKYGKGSTFTIFIPQRITKEGEVGDYAARAKESQKKNRNHVVKFIAPKARVLVVDDNSMNLKVFKLLLRETKVQVTLAGGGQEAIEILENERFDLIFLDHLMPEMDGIETLKKIKELYPDITSPIIALTANAISGAREMYLENGFDGYLSKPIVASDLEDMIFDNLDESLVE